MDFNSEKKSASSLRYALLACAVFGAAAAVVGCPVPPSDLGQGPCFLVKRNPDGGTDAVRIKESELTQGKDFISFGSTECENYVCVRDKDAPPSGDPNSDAVGYCTKDCSPASPSSCAISPKTAQFDPGASNARPLSCRPLILDEITIGNYCNDPANQARCDELFGPNRSPYFCARGGTAGDGGTSTDGGTP